MSRKTRKLIWSAPLVAVLAVAGALAIFVALSPQEAAAHETAMHGAPGSVTGLTAAQATGNDANGEPAGRTQITLTWMTPAAGMGDPATGYRIDYSDDTRVWRNLQAAVMDTNADMYCGTDAADGLRCYIDMSLKPGTERHYRVFAMNNLGISPISVNPTYATAMTLPYANPSPVQGLTATTHHVDQIVLDWQVPTDTGGAEIQWYCLALAATEGTIPNLTDTGQAGNCLDVTKATTGDVAYSAEGTTIVVAGDTTSYTQGMLTTPKVISLYYRVYSVTDSDGDQAIDANPTGRLIAMAASNIANGRTVAPLDVIDTSVTTTPRAVTNLRWVGSLGPGGTAAELRLYWTLPSNYPKAPVGENPDLRPNWSAEVSRWDPALKEGAGDWAVVTAVVAESPRQWQSAPSAVDELATARQRYRVRYINDAGTMGAGEPETDDDASGVERRFSVPQLTADVFTADVLPQIEASESNDSPGLRFAYNQIHPDTWLDLIWDEEENANDDVPTGYEIDVTEATTIDANTVWTPVRNQPIDLGATRQYTHKGVTPGKQYTYRVFAEFGGYLGIPAVEEASSRGADLPAPVRGLRVVPAPDNPQTSLVLHWPAVTNNGGHDIMGYLVQVASDEDNNKTLDAAATWENLPIRDDETTTGDESELWSVDKDTTTYTYDGSTAAPLDPLSGGFVRWFRVFAMTVENDGLQTTGGTAIDVTSGRDSSPRSDEGTAVPTPADVAGAETKSGMTDDPRAPADPTQIMSPPAPEDLTAEQASDTNEILPTERGVLLLWNEPEDPTGITGYVIQRKVDDGEWITIGSIGWVGEDDSRERTSFTDSREYIEGEDLYYQVGSRGASTVLPTYAMPIMYPAAHMDHVLADAPTAVMAAATSDTMITVTWEAPASNGGSDITGYVLQRAYKDADDMMTDFMTIAATDAATWWNTLDCSMKNAAIPDDATPAPPADDADTDSPYCAMYDGLTDDAMEEVDAAFAADYGTITDTSYMDTGLMPETMYYYRVSATNAVGNSAWSDGMAMAMTDAPASTELTKPDEVMAESNAVGELMLTWEGGANADSFLLIAVNMVDTSDYKTADVSDGAARMGTVAGLTSGVNYLGIVVALQGTGADETYSYGASSVQAVQ